VPEYWVLDLDRRRLLLHRAVNADTGEYADVREYEGSARVTAGTLELPELALADVLAAADA
jgi:hypothetical protein